MVNKEDVLNYFKTKYSWIEYCDLDITYETAKEKIINTLFPFDDTITEIPEKHKMKIYEVMEEIIDTGNMRHYTSYKENGVSWTRNADIQLQSLADLTPYAG